MPAEIRNTPHRLVLPQPVCDQYASAWMIGRHGVIVTQSGEIVAKSVGGEGYYLRDCLTWNNLAEIRRIKRGDVPGSAAQYPLAATLVHRFSGGYYHWLLESLPRLQALESYIHNNGINPMILLPPGSKRFIYESLNLLGYAGTQLQEWDGQQTQVEQLIFPGFRDYYNWLPQTVIQWMRDRFITASLNMRHQIPAANPRCVYVSRRKARRRQLVNEEELLYELQVLGFECRDLEDLSFSEQILWFKDADFIVGPHGAGLANMIWADHASVLEIFGQPVIPCYYKLALQSGHTYNCIQGQAANGNIKVNVPSVVKTVERMLGNH